MEVLQKIIAAAGYYSRRQADVLIRSGRVAVNGQKAHLGQRADGSEQITVDGKPLRPVAAKEYFILNKPVGYTCTSRNFSGEKNIFSLLPKGSKLTIVGRLDKDSAGLVLLTNDGNLAFRLTHPKFAATKRYQVKLAEDSPNVASLIKSFKSGVDIGEQDGLVWADQISQASEKEYLITLSQGRKRQIRRMFEAKGLRVKGLKRLSIGPIELGDLPVGHYRALSAQELKQLKV